MQTPTHRSFSRQLILSALTIIAIAIFVIAAFTAWSVSLVDGRVRAREQGYVTYALHERITDLPVQQTSATSWDEAVREVKAHNAAWMSDNLTVWMQTYFGHDRDYVLDEQDRPVQVAVGGKLVGNSVFDKDSPVLEPLIARLRAEMRKASAGQEDSTAAVTPLGTEDVLHLDGQPAIVSIKPIVPSTPALTQAPGTEYLHIAVQNIDATMAKAMATEFALEGIHVSASPRNDFMTVSMPVTDDAGKPVVYFTWNPDHPGLSVIRQAGPALAGGLIAGFALIGFMLRRLRHSSLQLQASEAQTQFLAFHDTLTGLPNRALFEDRLDRALAQSRRDGTKLALLCLDLDRFKNVNDTLGHPSGDELVRLAAARLVAAVREVDTVARLGGDEFAIVQVGIWDEQDAERLATRIATEFAMPFELFGDQAFVTVSIGISISQGNASTREDMLRKADIALYEAKSQGRARYRLFAGDMDDVVRQRRAIERDLRAALAQGGDIKAVYQPLFANDGSRIVGAEALARWDHPVHGALSPQLFIAIAEERGLIEQLGEHILRQACAFALQTDLPWVAVNVSPVQFRNERLVDRVMAILDETGLAPQRLQLEITEGVLLDNHELADRMIDAFRAKGVCIALDDFGTGYSSMSYLRRYGVDKLKIDRSFIRELGVSEDADAIVRAMVSLGRALRMQVTAEGVETTDQREQLTAIGCHELQGFLLSRPLPAEQFAELLARKGTQVETRRAL